MSVINKSKIKLVIPLSDKSIKIIVKTLVIIYDPIIGSIFNIKLRCLEK